MRKIIFTILLVILFIGCGQNNYLNETTEEKEQRLEWWKDAKFGMFIHWGAYSVPAGWYRNEMYPNASEWLMDFANISPAEYEQYPKQFNPVEYNPEKWVQIAKQAGMKYIVITSKHHDGFCIWDSKVTNYDIVDFSPYKKDLLKPLYDACLREGIKIGFYHSIMDWHHPDAVGETFPKYRDEYMIPQLEELLHEFPELAIMWFDGEWIDEWTEEQGKELYNHLRNISPDLIINNRIGKGRQGMQGMNKDLNAVGDFGTPEQEILETSSTLPWESCMTMNDSWGFKKGDENWKSAETLIFNIIDIASKGGNYLLNVGPDSKGNIPDASIERLTKVGNWMDKNGEGIYNTRQIKNYVEDEKIRFTKSKDSQYIYVYILEQPNKNIASFSYVSPKENSDIILLGSKTKLQYSVIDKITSVILPDELKEEDFPICLKINGIENNVSEKPKIVVNDGSIKESYLFQDEIKIELVSENNSDIFFTLDGTTPNTSSKKYSSPIILNNSAELLVIAKQEDYIISPIISAQFYKIESIKSIELKNLPSEKYSESGKLILVDGERGSNSYTSKWLGFEGTDFEATIDLGELKKVNNITLGALSNINSWIFLPKEVKFSTSLDKAKFKEIGEISFSVDRNDKQNAFVKDISQNINSKIRYIKIQAENIKECPTWHIGAGGKAWIFFDEIIID